MTYMHPYTHARDRAHTLRNATHGYCEHNSLSSYLMQGRNLKTTGKMRNANTESKSPEPKIEAGRKKAAHTHTERERDREKER